MERCPCECNCVRPRTSTLMGLCRICTLWAAIKQYGLLRFGSSKR